MRVCVCDVFMLQARAELSGVAYYMLIVVNYSGLDWYQFVEKKKTLGKHMHTQNNHSHPSVCIEKIHPWTQYIFFI